MLNQHPGFQLVTHDDRRDQSHAVPFAGEQAQHCHVINFSEYNGPDPCQIQQMVEADPDVTVEARQQEATHLEFTPKACVLSPCARHFLNFAESKI